MNEGRSDAQDEDLLCPRCDYMLRGLTEPRCPECGLRFDWEELKNRGPGPNWLFDQKINPCVRSFISTVVRSLVPWRFWKSIQLTHRPSGARLVAFFTVAVLLIPMVILGPIFGSEFVDQIQRNWQANAVWLARLSAKPPPAASRTGLAISHAGGVQPYVDSIYPTSFLANARDFARSSRIEWEPMVAAFIVLAGWPLSNFASIFIFESSLRRSKPGRWHVMRCATYPFSNFLLAAMVAGAISLLHMNRTLSESDAVAMVTLIALVAFLAYSFSYMVAMKRFLKIDRPIATGLLSLFVGACLTSIAVLSFAQLAGNI